MLSKATIEQIAKDIKSLPEQELEEALAALRRLDRPFYVALRVHFWRIDRDQWRKMWTIDRRLTPEWDKP